MVTEGRCSVKSRSSEKSGVANAAVSTQSLLSFAPSNVVTSGVQSSCATSSLPVAELAAEYYATFTAATISRANICPEYRQDALLQIVNSLRRELCSKCLQEVKDIWLCLRGK